MEGFHVAMSNFLYSFFVWSKDASGELTRKGQLKKPPPSDILWLCDARLMKDKSRINQYYLFTFVRADRINQQRVGTKPYAV